MKLWLFYKLIITRFQLDAEHKSSAQVLNASEELAKSSRVLALMF